MGIAWKCIFTFLTMLRNSVLNFLYEKNIFLYVLKWCFFVCVVYRQIRCKIAPVQFSKNYTVFEWKIAQRYQSFGVCFSPQFMRMWCARYSYWINLLVIFLPFWSSDFLGLSCIWFGLMNELVRSRSDPFPRICGSYQRPEDKCMFWLVSPYQI
jgi:hypothetical protein